jgi:hypothetical protein
MRELVREIYPGPILLSQNAADETRSFFRIIPSATRKKQLALIANRAGAGLHPGQ